LPQLTINKRTPPGDDGRTRLTAPTFFHQLILLFTAV
jgi:hypothetical protein